jgi:hypothetical protein
LDIVSLRSNRRRRVVPECYARANEMDAAVWTAIGLLAATSLGTLFYLGSRIDALASRIDARFDRVDARFDHMEERFDALASRLDAHLDRHTS